MRQTIWKFETEVTDRFTLKMPSGGQILTLQIQNEKPCIWALVNPENDPEERFFELFGTGHEMESMGINRKYIGTYPLQNGAFIFHLF